MPQFQKLDRPESRSPASHDPSSLLTLPEGRLETTTKGIGELYDELKSQERRLQNNLGVDSCGLFSSLQSIAQIDGIERLMRQRRETDLKILEGNNPQLQRGVLVRIETELQQLCVDRIERLNKFNTALEEGTINVRRLNELRASGDMAAFQANKKEIFDIFQRDPALMFIRLPQSHEDAFRRGNVIAYPGVAVAGSQVSVETLRIQQKDLATTTSAVQTELLLLQKHFSNVVDFNEVIVWSGVQSIQSQLDSYSGKQFLLSRTIDRAARERLEADSEKIRKKIHVLSIDFLERSQAMRDVLQVPEARDRMFADITRENRDAFIHVREKGGRQEKAEAYHKAIRQLITVLNSSPEQIRGTRQVSPIPSYTAPLTPNNQPRPVNTGKQLSEQIAPPARERFAPNDFSGLPAVSGQRAIIRAQAFERCKFAAEQVLEIALTTRMQPTSAHELEQAVGRLNLAGQAWRVKTHDFASEPGARKMLEDTNALFANTTSANSPIREILSLRLELQRKRDELFQQNGTVAETQRSLLLLRDEYAGRMAKVIDRSFPMMKSEELHIAQRLLPARELTQPSETKGQVSPRKAVEQSIVIPPTPPIKIEAKEVVFPPPVRPSVALDTTNRLCIQPLAATESSLIHVHCVVNGEPLLVSYDTVRRKFLSDQTMAEKTGVRFVHTGEVGPNGLPKIQVELTLGGQYSVEYNGVNNRTAGKWSGKIAPRSAPELNDVRMSETKMSGLDRWHSSIPSASKLADGSSFIYAYSKEDSRFYAKSPDGKLLLAYDEQKRSWHTFPAEGLPSILR